jgi:hypothetical protein
MSVWSFAWRIHKLIRKVRMLDVVAEEQDHLGAKWKQIRVVYRVLAGWHIFVNLIVFFCISVINFIMSVWSFVLSDTLPAVAPATFERLMETVLAGLQWDICLIYLDDVIVLGRSYTDGHSFVHSNFRNFSVSLCKHFASFEKFWMNFL